jgi:TatD DNase family protein
MTLVDSPTTVLVDSPTTLLVDSHCHLDFPEFADELDAVVARAGEAGIGWMLTICTRVSLFDQIVAIAEAHDNIFCTVGIHPHEAADEPTVTADDLLRIGRHPKVVGFGETGLDFYYENSPREAQETSFRAHIAAARQSGLPVIIHSREADDDMARILADEHDRGAFPGVIHCFTAGAGLARRALDLGLHISFSGIVTFKNAADLREIAAEVPIERLLVETDAPYLAPVPMRGKRNEPAFTAHTAATLAEIRGIPSAEMARLTTENFFRLFSKASATA